MKRCFVVSALFAVALTVVVSMATLPVVIAAEAHIYNFKNVGAQNWGCSAENDIYYDDVTNLINIAKSKVSSGAWIWPPGSYSVKSQFTHLDSYYADAYMDAGFGWFFSSWKAKAYAWTDPPYWGGYAKTY